MVFAILIGFQYSCDRFLPGIVVDLYQTYRYLLAVYPNIKPIVITDLKQDSKATPLMHALVSDITDTGVLTFIETLEKNNSLYRVNDENMEDVIDKVITSVSFLREDGFLYYTGHGIAVEKGNYLEGNWLLPNNKKLPISTIISRFANGVTRSMIIIIDCCGTGEIPLPYRLCVDNTKGRYRLNLSIPEEELIYSEEDILVLTSTRHDEKSTITNSGSIFTRTLTNLLLKKFREHQPVPNLIQLVREIDQSISELQTGHQQSTSVYTSLPQGYQFPSWFNGIQTEIELDNKYCFLRLRPLFHLVV
jgi:hypothetical protein